MKCDIIGQPALYSHSYSKGLVSVFARDQERKKGKNWGLDEQESDESRTQNSQKAQVSESPECEDCACFVGASVSPGVWVVEEVCGLDEGWRIVVGA